MRSPLVPLLAAAALVLTGCSGDDGADLAADADNPARTAAATPSEEVSGSGTGGADRIDSLTIALDEDFGPLNLFAENEERLNQLIYDHLVAPSPYVEDPQAWLAEEVTRIDPSTWEVDLRTDVTWHDGEEFTAEDVVFTVEYFKVAPVGRYTHHVNDIPTIEADAVDADTVRFDCAFPCPRLGSVTLADLPILPEHVWDDVFPAEAKEATVLPVGTGPYKLVDYDPSSGYRFEANEDYFAGVPRVKELVMPIITEPQTAFTALRSGQIDATTHHVPPELIEAFEDSDEISLIKTAPFHFPHLVLNYKRAPFDDPDVRLAISRALNREELLETVFLGYGRPALHGYAHPDTPFANPDIETPYDPDESRELLDEAGFTDADADGVREGEDGPLSFEIIVDGARPVQTRGAELVAEYLTEIGLATTVETLDAGTLSARNAEDDYDMKISEITAHGIASPVQFIMSHRSGYLWDKEIPYPAWDALFADWKDETTVEGRLDVLHRMQAQEASAPVGIPLYYPDEYWAVDSERYDGWAESPGFGIVHKWSFLPAEAGEDANAVVGR